MIIIDGYAGIETPKTVSVVVLDNLVDVSG